MREIQCRTLEGNGVIFTSRAMESVGVLFLQEDGLERYGFHEQILGMSKTLQRKYTLINEQESIELNCHAYNYYLKQLLIKLLFEAIADKIQNHKMSLNNGTDRDLEKSELSTSFDYQISEQNYLHYFKSLTQENSFIKEALQTAENLIQTYRSDNLMLKEQNRHLQKKLLDAEKSIKVLKGFIWDSERKNERSLVNRQDSGVQACSEFAGEKQVDVRVVDLENQIRSLMNSQERYEEKITNLNSHLTILQNQMKAHEKPKFTLNIGINETCFSSETEKGDHKTKNLSELRALHLKIQAQDKSTIRQNRVMGEGSEILQRRTLAERVFSSDRLKSEASTVTPMKKKKNISNTSTFRKKK